SGGGLRRVTSAGPSTKPASDPDTHPPLPEVGGPQNRCPMTSVSLIPGPYRHRPCSTAGRWSALGERVVDEGADHGRDLLGDRDALGEDPHAHEAVDHRVVAAVPDGHAGGPEA